MPRKKLSPLLKAARSNDIFPAQQPRSQTIAELAKKEPQSPMARAKQPEADDRRATKRRRVAEEPERAHPDGQQIAEGDEEYATAAEDAASPGSAAEEQEDGGVDLANEEFGEEDEYGEDYDEEDEDGASPATTSKKLKALSSKRLEASQKAVKRTGVIYISRVPPFMKPSVVRNLLSPYGEIGRIFLTPEDPEIHKKRVKSGGNKKKSFTDGWVEFLNKKDAKLVAETLNTQIIGGKKGSWYHDDVWNIKYLKGFKWHHLTEQIANENAERAARMRAEIAQATRENKIFLQNVERAKMMETREVKNKRKLENGDAAVTSGGADREVCGKPATDGRNYRSQFRQNEVKRKAPKEGPAEQSEDVKRVLGKIF